MRRLQPELVAKVDVAALGAARVPRHDQPVLREVVAAIKLLGAELEGVGVLLSLGGAVDGREEGTRLDVLQVDLAAVGEGLARCGLERGEERLVELDFVARLLLEHAEARRVLGGARAPRRRILLRRLRRRVLLLELRLRALQRDARVVAEEREHAEERGVERVGVGGGLRRERDARAVRAGAEAIAREEADRVRREEVRRQDDDVAKVERHVGLLVQRRLVQRR